MQRKGRTLTRGLESSKIANTLPWFSFSFHIYLCLGVGGDTVRTSTCKSEREIFGWSWVQTDLG
jgi:hypothetical protein